MSENTMTHPALTVLAALCAGQTITEPSGRRVCLGYDTENDNRRVLAVIADRERPGQPPDTVLLPLDETVTGFIEWAAKLPATAVLPADAPIESDYIGAFLLGDVRTAVPELTETQCVEILDDHRSTVEAELKAALRQCMLRLAQENALLPPPPDADPLHIGDFGLEDARATLPELSDAALRALLADIRDDLEERLGEEFRALLRDLADDWNAEDDKTTASDDPAPF